MLDASLATRYANALFSTAQEQGTTTAVLEELAGLIGVVAGDLRLQKFFYHPAISPAQKKNMLDDIPGLQLTPLSRRFLSVLFDAKRIHYLGLIHETVTELFNRYNNRVRAGVTSAFPLDGALQRSVRERVEAYLGKKVDMEFTVDASLLGGIKLTVDDKVIDGSVIHNLKKLETKIALG